MNKINILVLVQNKGSLTPRAFWCPFRDKLRWPHKISFCIRVRCIYDLSNVGYREYYAFSLHLKVNQNSPGLTTIIQQFFNMTQKSVASVIFIIQLPYFNSYKGVFTVYKNKTKIVSEKITLSMGLNFYYFHLHISVCTVEV